MADRKNRQPVPEKEELEKERHELLERIQDALEIPMIVLGLGWLVLLIIEFTKGLNPLLQTLSNIIWGIFIIDFLIKFALAPDKGPFLKKNIITMISLALPALRVLRIARAVRLIRTVRAARSLRLVKVIGSLNRGLRSLGATMQRRAFGYVLALTVTVLLTGAAGMYAFENDQGGNLTSYGKALWWTAMVLITMGSEYWPRSPEGQILCLILAIYGFAVFGYFTALLATYFLGRDAEAPDTEIAGAQQIKDLQHEIQLLRKDILSLRIPPAQPGQIGQEKNL
jgi:voltage-gated potassium channel